MIFPAKIIEEIKTTQLYVTLQKDYLPLISGKNVKFNEKNFYVRYKV